MNYRPIVFPPSNTVSYQISFSKCFVVYFNRTWIEKFFIIIYQGDLSHVAASRNDMWAYLSHNLIVLVKPRNGISGSSDSNSSETREEDSFEKNWPDFSLIGVSNTKYSSISFCQSKWDALPVENSPLVSGCEEGFVRIWDLNGIICRMYHNNHKVKFKVNVPIRVVYLIP